MYIPKLIDINDKHRKNLHAQPEYKKKKEYRTIYGTLQILYTQYTIKTYMWIKELLHSQKHAWTALENEKGKQM